METYTPLVDAARDKIRTRLPHAQFAVAAAMQLDDGQILTSIGFDNFNAAANLCAETGALCEAFTLDRVVVASLCLAKEAGKSDYLVLAPCGICQERLALWGAAGTGRCRGSGRGPRMEYESAQRGQPVLLGYPVHRESCVAKHGRTLRISRDPPPG